MDAVDQFVAQLQRTLSGPRRAKSEMLDEISDGLHDTVDARRRGGLDVATAQERALAEFGTVEQLAPALQAELAATQARRTALLITVVLASQPLLWAAVDALLTDGAHTGQSRSGYALVNALTQWMGAGTIIACLLASALVIGPGVRHVGCPTTIARAVGALGYGACVVFAALGVALTLLGSAPDPWTVAGLPTTALLLGAPLIGVGVGARRCRRAAYA